LQKVSDEHFGKVSINWRGFPMVPGIGGPYLTPIGINHSRLRASVEEPDLLFSPWPDKPPPSGSMPALAAGCCVLFQGEEHFKQLHFSIFRAYFEENQDISRREVLIELGENTGLDIVRFEKNLKSGRGRAELESERRALLEKGNFNGVPTAYFGLPYPLVGAVPIQVYQRAVEKLVNP
jgi:hypothetical protein